MIKLLLTNFILLTFLVATAQNRRPVDPQLQALLDQTDSVLLQKELSKLETGSKEQDLTLAIQYYSSKRNTAKTDALVEMAVKKFPKGQYAFNEATGKQYSQEGAEEKEKLYKMMQKQFPDKNISMPAYDVAYAYAQKADDANALKYIALINDNNFRPQAMTIVGEELIQKGKLKAAEYLIKSVMDTMSARLSSYKPDPNQSAGPQQRGNNPKMAYYNSTNSYSRLLYKMGKVDEAFRYVKEAYDSTNQRNSAINEHYLNMLIATKRHKDALPLMEEAIKKGVATKHVKDNFEVSYKAVKGSSEGFAAYKAQLEDVLRNKIREDVAKLLIKQPSAGFTLVDTKGQSVSLDDLKGKTVVLDFWATWCGPCKKSFPAMQMAVDKYKNDPDVVFLFIHTWERGEADPTEAAAKYVADNNFSFIVLMDKKDPVTAINKVVTDYKVSGIPTKFIIDPNGDIRFKLSGFSGGDDAAVEELSAMIELARGNKS